MGKRISMIIPVFNSQDYIERCLNSICKQSISEEIEIIIVDDCCTDDTVEIALSTIQRNSFRGEYSVITHGTNKGAAESRIDGINNACGDFIMFCDSDDWIDMNMCKSLLDCAIEKNADLVVCGFKSIHNDDSVDFNPHCTSDYLRGLLLCSESGSLCTKLIKRELLQDKRMEYPTRSFCEDFAYSVQLSILAKKIELVPIAFYNYCHRENSIVTTQSKEAIKRRLEDNLINYEIAHRAIKDNGLESKYKDEIISLKLTIKNSIRPYVSSREFHQLWRDTFPELSNEIFRSRLISNRSKLAFILTWIGAYPIIKRIMN